MEENNTVVYIPPNFYSGTAILGFTIRLSYVAQGLPLVVIFIILVFTLGRSFSLTTRLVAMIVLCVPVLIISATGINGSSIFGFIRTYSRYRKNVRICHYNARVKKEAEELMANDLDRPISASDRIRGIFFNASSKLNKTDGKLDTSENVSHQYFDDDEGFVRKPPEYMSGKEYRQYKKRKKEKTSK